MGIPTSEVGYTSATTGRGDHEVHKRHVVALEKKITSINTLREQKNSHKHLKSVKKPYPSFYSSSCFNVFTKNLKFEDAIY
jgi:ribosomal protein L34E